MARQSKAHNSETVDSGEVGNCPPIEQGTNHDQISHDSHERASQEMLDAARALALNKTLTPAAQLSALKVYDSLLKSRLDDSKAADIPLELRKFLDDHASLAG